MRAIYLKPIFLCLLISLISLSSSAEIASKLRLGNHQFNFTIPQGSLLITEGPLFDALQQMVQPPLEGIGYLLQQEELDLVGKGQKEWFDRSHTLAQHIELEQKILSRDSFETIKRKMMSGRSLKLEDNLSSANEFFQSRQEQNVDQKIQASIRASGAYTAPPHVVGRNLIGQTSFIKFQMQIEDADIASEDELIVANTTTIIYLRGKVLYLVSSAPKIYSQWTRTASVGVAQAILEENSASSKVQWLAIFGEPD